MMAAISRSWPGLSASSNRHIGHTARLDEAAGDDAGEDRDVDVAAGDKAHDLLALDVHLVEHGGGHSHGARALGNELLLLDEREHGGGNLVIRHGDDAVHVLLREGRT